MDVKRAKKGLATPVSLSFLLFSFTLLTVTTYYFVMSSVDTKANKVSFVAAKNAMLSLESSIKAIVWSPGSSAVQHFKDYHGKFEVEPDARRLIINLTFDSSTYTVFNSSIGLVKYEMPPADVNQVGWFLRGDKRVIINQSFAGTAQMYIENGENSQELRLGYRPLAVSYQESQDGSTVNVVRIYIINLNSSESLWFKGSFRVKARCLNVTVDSRSYNFSGGVSSVIVRASVDGDEGTVTLPLSSSGSFTLVRVEVLVCNIRLEEVE